MFDKYPYTDFHEMNLDWIIQEMKQLIDDWEEFTGSVSATAHEAEDPEVSVTGDLKDGLVFDFGLVRGPRGLTGIRGPEGPKGDTGSGLEILDIYPDLASLQAAHPTGTPGDAYLVGTGGNYTLYIWSATASAWSDAGSLTSPAPSSSAPAMDGVAAAGSSLLYSRGDHVHPADTSKLDKSSGTGVYAVDNGTQTMLGFSDNSVPNALVEYDSVGEINGTNINLSGTLEASSLNITNDTVLNSEKLKALVNGGNAHQAIANNNPIDMLYMGVDSNDNTPTVAFAGVKYDSSGTMTDAGAAVGFSTSFTTNYADYDSGRIDLADASSTLKGGVIVGSGIDVEDGVISNAYRAGDIYSANGYSVFTGVSTSTTSFRFLVPVPKEIEGTPTVTALSLNVYMSPTGRILNNYNVMTDGDYTVQCSKRGSGIIVYVTRSSDISNLTANQPLSVATTDLTINFN